LKLNICRNIDRSMNYIKTVLSSLLSFVAQLVRLSKIIYGVRHRVMFTSMDQFNIIDKNKEFCCVEKQNKYCVKYLALFSICKPHFAHLAYLQLFEKKNY
jgi:hypothetical protein